jgi:hypothetical protein
MGEKHRLLKLLRGIETPDWKKFRPHHASSTWKQLQGIKYVGEGRKFGFGWFSNFSNFPE